MTLKRVPELSIPTVTTAVSIGSVSRETIVWRFKAMALAMRVASAQQCGMAPWPAFPKTSISNSSPAAIIGPVRTATWPVGTSDQT